MSIWDRIQDTGESFLGAGAAPLGFLWDVASSPFDEDDDSVLGNMGARGSQILDPLLNEDTITGFGAGKVMDGANWVLDHGVNRPIGTFFSTIHHAGAGDSVGERVGTMFSGDDWARAWEMSDDQNAGQAMTNMVLSATPGDFQFDPFDYEDPYEERTHPDHGALASTISWGANVTGAFILDPFAVGGKALGAMRSYRQGAGGMGRLREGQRAELGDLLASPAGKEASRVDRFADFIGGNNTLNKPLSGPEILAASPELRKWSSEPHVIAGLLADTNRITDTAARKGAVRGILAAAGGDPMAIKRIQAQRDVLPYVADELMNLRRGNVLDLKHVAADPALSRSPVFVKHLEDQILRLDSDGAISKFIDEWGQHLDTLEGTQGTLRNLPGVHAGSNIPLRRIHDKGITRAPKHAHEAVDKKIDDWAQRRVDRLTAGEAKSVLIQKSAMSAPVMVARAAHLAGNVAVGPYTKFLPKVSDALRQTHFVAHANLEQWGDSVTQLDSMMKIAKVPMNARLGVLSEAQLLPGTGREAEKQAMIRRAEALAMKSMTERAAAKAGDKLEPGYVEALMQSFHSGRDATLGGLHGRAYAATRMTDEMGQKAVDRFEAAHAKGITAVEDDVTKAASHGKFSATPDGEKAWSLRVDSIYDESGMPLALPLLEPQLANRVPLLDIHLAEKLVKRDQGSMARLSRAWKHESEELEGLVSKRATARGARAVHLDKMIEKQYAYRDNLIDAGQRLNRAWKMSVLFRLGYPVRVVLDDHWRIWTQMNAGVFYAQNGAEAAKDFAFNRTRGLAARKTMAADRERLGELRDVLESDEVVAWGDRMGDLKKANRRAAAHRGQITKLRKSETVDEEKIAHHEKMIAEADADMARLQEDLGDLDPSDLAAERDEIMERLRAGKSAYMADKRGLGESDVALGDGLSIPGGYAGGHGAAMRAAASSKETFEYQQKGVEETMTALGPAGAQRTFTPEEPGHIGAWADTLNNQIRNSRVAMFFVKGGTVDDFVRWVGEPAQADLRRRLPHFAHDPEDWGERVIRMVEDYIPNQGVADDLVKGKAVNAKALSKIDTRDRPAVHGKAVRDNLGTSAKSLGIGRTIDRTFSWLSDQPTDRLSRHPFFNSMYKQHARELYATMKMSYAKNGVTKFSQSDLDHISRQARKLALGDLKRTLFDMSAHSHAAHVMRFVSPFFAAHQEVLTRWWKIVGENPGVLRRFQQAFDIPRHAGLVVDENGDPVQPGDTISAEHSIMVPAPHKLLPDWLVPDRMESDSTWEVTENSFNLVLQGGLTNPGAGPLLTIPVEAMTAAAADDERVARVARLLNPFPPDSPGDAAVPAWMKRAMAFAYGVDETKDLGVLDGVPGFLGNIGGIGQREYFDAVSRNLVDLQADFGLKFDRQPTKTEADALWDEALTQATVEAGLRFLSNATSPFPARPGSKYAAIQDSWWKTREIARQKFPDDFEAQQEWAVTTFKKEHGAAYMPLIYSDSNNPAGLDGSPADVAAFKKHRGLVQSVDPRLVRAITGPYAADSGLSEERTPEAVNYFEDQPLKPGSPTDFFDSDDPAAAFEERMARMGWDKYAELTGALTAQAQQMGLDSYKDSDVLDGIRREALAKLKDENFAFARDIDSFDAGKYDAYLGDMRKIVASPLAKDPARSDIQTMAAYLELRDVFTAVFDARLKSGQGGPDAQASEPLRALYTSLVGRLVESNSHFESFTYNGLVEFDPLLLDGE